MSESAKSEARTSSATILLTAVALAAFAGNSLIARVALREGSIDAVGFTALRILGGAGFLWLLIALPKGGRLPRGSCDWRPAVMLFAYAITFSLAYLELTAGTGALILFGAVQITMIGVGLVTGERFRPRQLAGALVAVGGLVYLTLPGVAAPPLRGAILMAASGVAWGVYSLLGRNVSNAAAATTANFMLAAPLALVSGAAMLPSLELSSSGVWWAILSGAITSGLGYIVWYLALPGLGSLRAGVSQLTVPVIAALGGAALLAEPVTVRLALSAVATLGGVALAVAGRSGSRR
ncbi:MAG: DMT family transporter [Armatimonadetes bacterium]|nr:DMT family transporter [Armatimonadota bacterium]